MFSGLVVSEDQKRETTWKRGEQKNETTSELGLAEVPVIDN